MTLGLLMRSRPALLAGVTRRIRKPQCCDSAANGKDGYGNGPRSVPAALNERAANKRRDDVRGRHQRLIKSHYRALAIERSASRQFRCKSGAEKRSTDEIERQEKNEGANLARHAETKKSRTHQSEGSHDNCLVGGPPTRLPHQKDLDDEIDKTSVGEYGAELCCPEWMSLPTEASRKKERNLGHKH